MAYQEHRQYQPGFPITARFFDSINFMAHWHSGFEIIIVYSGKLGMGINSDYRVLEAGDIAVCFPGDIHYYDSKDRTSEAMIIVFRPELLGDAVNFDQYVTTINNFIPSHTSRHPGGANEAFEDVKSCADSIMAEYMSQSRGYQLFVKADLIRLLALLSRNWSRDTEKNETMVGSSCIRQIQLSIKYIQENFKTEINLQDISDHLNISPFYFSRMFSKVTGTTFKNYVNSVRIEHAEAQIKSTKRPIIEIAYESGFNSIRTFNRVFKSVTGLTPSEIRTSVS